MNAATCAASITVATSVVTFCLGVYLGLTLAKLRQAIAELSRLREQRKKPLED
jgi:hypothetical protein